MALIFPGVLIILSFEV